jgi:hypothetical protein
MECQFSSEVVFHSVEIDNSDVGDLGAWQHPTASEYEGGHRTTWDVHRLHGQFVGNKT